MDYTELQEMFVLLMKYEYPQIDERTRSDLSYELALLAVGAL